MPSGTLLTPIGPIIVEADETQLLAVRIGADGARGDANALVDEALLRLRAWFDDPATPLDLPLAPARTLRGRALRAAIAAVPPGTTASYGELARRAGSSPRAIGQACARNLFPIVVPCHRVIGAGGAPGQYSAGDGLATKQWLLAHERGGRHG